jgi:pSer/pThr/pTyr-binding forkhead associated (FHA) protein
MTTLVHVFTRTDSAASEWAIDDEIVRLRQWGTDIVHGLPTPPIHECTVGAGSTSGVRLDDPAQMVSRLHARLTRDRGGWQLVDLDSKNGLRADGARRGAITLAPGLEIGIGGVTLVAESPLSIDLRGFLARLLGWSSDRTAVVDHALRSVRLAASRRVALVLCGDGDLVPTAQSIHQRSRGADRPFIVCDPRRQGGKATVRSAEGYTTGKEALAAATGGSLCVRARRLPADFDDLVAALRVPQSSIQLIVCGETEEDCARHAVTPIVIPPLAGRASELGRIIDEYARDAIAELASPEPGFPQADRDWVREHASTSLPEIEKATLRLVALRSSRSLSNAASRLGMAPVSLSRWIGRRQLPMKVIQ